MRMERTADTIVLREHDWDRLLGGAPGFVTGAAFAVLPWVLDMDYALAFTAAGVAFAVLGAAVMLSANSRTVSLEKDGRVTITRKRYAGAHENVEQVDASQVVGVLLVTATVEMGPASSLDREFLVSRLALVFGNGGARVIASRRRRLSVYGFSVPPPQTTPLRREAQAVADLYGVRLEMV